MTAVALTATEGKRRAAGNGGAMLGVLLVTPIVLTMFALVFYPLVQTVWESLHRINPMQAGTPWVGAGNYINMLSDASAGESWINPLIYDGFAILKVGPGLTFALREALYGLDAIVAELDGSEQSLQPAMESLTLAHPQHWSAHYPGTSEEQRLQRISATAIAFATIGPIRKRRRQSMPFCGASMGARFPRR